MNIVDHALSVMCQDDSLTTLDLVTKLFIWNIQAIMWPNDWQLITVYIVHSGSCKPYNVGQVLPIWLILKASVLVQKLLCMLHTALGKYGLACIYTQLMCIESEYDQCFKCVL